MIDPFATAVAELLRHPTVRAALREALGAPSPDEWIPLKDAIKLLGFDPADPTDDPKKKTRILTDAAARGELPISGPRRSRVVKRADLTRWLESRGIGKERRRRAVEPRAADAPADERAEAQAAVLDLASRIRRAR